MTSSELYHHGILNMHWGERHGPPYPLDRDVSTGKSLKKGAPRSSSKKGSLDDSKKKKKLGFFAARKKKKQDAEKMAKLREIKAKKAAERLRQKAEETAWEDAKKQIIQRGDVETARKYIDKFSNEELSALSERSRLLNSLQVKPSKYSSEEERIRDNIIKNNDLQKAYDNQRLFSSNELQDMINKQSNLDKIKEKNRPLTKAESAAKTAGRVADIVLNNAQRIENIGKIAKSVDDMIKIFEGRSDAKQKVEKQAAQDRKTATQNAQKARLNLWNKLDQAVKEEGVSDEDKKTYDQAKKLINAASKNPEKVTQIWNTVKDQSFDSLWADPERLFKYLKSI